jgi:amidophosphoribosyltransferase
VHVRISSPPVTHPCFYGIDISSSDELIACNQSVQDIGNHVGADSLAYLSNRALLQTVEDGIRYCTACFTGDFPTEVPGDNDK